MKKYLTLDSVLVIKKIVGIRVDINSAIINGKVEVSGRIKEACSSIKELLDKGARVLIFAHQGRKGKSDFTSLTLHKEALEHILNTQIEMISTISKRSVEESLKKHPKQQLFLLENLRELDVEQKPQFTPKGQLIQNEITKIIELCDLYILDAFSISHRAHSSVLGNPKVPLIAGRLLQKELKPLNILEHTQHPRIFMMGGVKPDDLIPLLKKSLENNSVDTILLGGVIGELALHIKGYYLGKKWDWIDKNEYNLALNDLKQLLEKFPKQFQLPLDVAYLDSNNKRVEVPINKLTKNNTQLKEYLIEDIGSLTIEAFSKIVKKSQSCYVKGPIGNFEKKGLEVGTYTLFRTIVHSDTFSFMGGGHTLTAAEISKTKNLFSYVSLAGGALVQFLEGKTLPGIKAVEDSYSKFSSKLNSHLNSSMHFDTVVVGSNVIDTFINSSVDIDSSILGEKIKVDDNFTMSVGGGGINVSSILSKLQGKVGLITRLSNESLELVQKSTKENEVQILTTKSHNTPSSKSILIETPSKDRVIFTHRGQNQDFSMSDVPKDLPYSNYYFSGLTKTAFNTQMNIISKLKKQQGCTMICYNPSSYTIQLHEEEIMNYLKYIDVLIFNKEEAQLLTHQEGINNNLHLLSSLGPKFVIITDGSKGSYGISSNSNEINYQKSPSTSSQIVDTTGAGDCYAATCFYFLAKQYSLEESMKLATINAAHLITQRGSTKGSLTLKELKAKRYKIPINF
ncbi:MAG: phosphoglycerate kinase [Candidatus Woesearchaeota archaeon]